MRSLLAGLALCLLAPLARADTEVQVTAERLRVIDGDTVALAGVRVDLGPVSLPPDEVSVRLLGYDTPETRRAECAAEAELGHAATAELEDMIASGARLVLHVDGELDRYGRLLARLEVDGVDVGDALMGLGMARPYDGGRREGWC